MPNKTPNANHPLAHKGAVVYISVQASCYTLAQTISLDDILSNPDRLEDTFDELVNKLCIASAVRDREMRLGHQLASDAKPPFNPSFPPLTFKP